MPANDPVLRAAEALRQAVDTLDFSEPVRHVYNPLDYAWACHAEYIRRFGRGPRRVVFLGMNPGPFGMTQTGVPFGEIAAARDWLGISARPEPPACQHPARPVEGYACTRSEVSGRRLWGLFAERFGTAENFFAEHYVANYCPLVFLEQSGRNRTPDKLPAAEAAALIEACDAHLRALLEAFRPEWVIGIGGFAEKCLQRVAGNGRPSPAVGRILHPSPASPAANRGWARAATGQMVDLGVWPG
jgi:single-strand selective monofunctional uracil DNA glycosylase